MKPIIISNLFNILLIGIFLLVGGLLSEVNAAGSVCAPGCVYVNGCICSLNPCSTCGPYPGEYPGQYPGEYSYPGESSYPGEYPGQYGGEYWYQYQGEPNLDVTSIGFYDRNGNSRSSKQYDPLEPIYLRVGVKNTGDGYPQNTSRHAVYRNKPSSVSTGTSSDIPMYIDSGTNWPPGFTAIYESWPGGVRASHYTAQNFSNSVIGTSTLRVFADYNNRVAETASSDNQMTATYTILSPDLTVPDFELFDQDGVIKGSANNPFFTTDMIFPSVTFSNVGNGKANALDDQTDSRIYAHLVSVPAQSLTPNPGVSMLTGEYAAGESVIYAPAPSNTNEWAFTGTPYFTRSTPGTYTAWSYVNYNHQNVESNYTNNTRSYTYNVETPYSISGRVYVDEDYSGSYSTGDRAVSGIGLSISGSPSSSPSAVTSSTGQYSFARLRAGTYTVTMQTPTGFSISNNGGSNTYTYALGPNRTTADFAITGAYSISGEAFVDENSDGIKNGADAAYTGTPSVAITARPSSSPLPNITNPSSGAYSITGLIGPQGFYTGNSLVGYSGIGYLVTGLNLGRFYSTTTTNNSSVTYSVNFPTTGTYRIWTRGWAPSGNDDSYHLFLDNAAVTTSDDIDIIESAFPRYSWSSQTLDGTAPTINIPSAGVHTLTIRTREDGAFIDKIYLTTNQSSTAPTDQGPAQSAISGGVFQESGGQLTIEAENFSSSTQSSSSYSLSMSTPQGYFAVSPIPPAYSMDMTGTCPINPSPSPASPPTCATGSLTNLNFAFSPGAAWLQTRGGDARFDTGFSDPIPATPFVACQGAVASRTGPQSTSPGVIFSGDRNPSFGAGSASSTNWRVGSSTYPEVYKPVNPTTLRTSYEYIVTSAKQQNISFTDLGGVCSGGLGNCSISNLQSGYYKANGDLVLSSFTMASGAKIVLIVNGTLDINTNINVPQGSSLVVSSKGSITVDSSVGAVVSGGAISCPSDGQVEGLYSTNNDFIIEANHNCAASSPDKMLAIEGAVVVQADLNGGSLTNQRTLCNYNTDYPTLVVTSRPDMILNMPEVIKVPTYTWREVAP